MTPWFSTMQTLWYIWQREKQIQHTAIKQQDPLQLDAGLEEGEGEQGQQGLLPAESNTDQLQQMVAEGPLILSITSMITTCQSQRMTPWSLRWPTGPTSAMQSAGSVLVRAMLLRALASLQLGWRARLSLTLSRCARLVVTAVRLWHAAAAASSAGSSCVVLVTRHSTHTHTVMDGKPGQTAFGSPYHPMSGLMMAPSSVYEVRGPHGWLFGCFCPGNVQTLKKSVAAAKAVYCPPLECSACRANHRWLAPEASQAVDLLMHGECNLKQRVQGLPVCDSSII